MVLAPLKLGYSEIWALPRVISGDASCSQFGEIRQNSRPEIGHYLCKNRSPGLSQIVTDKFFRSLLRGNRLLVRPLLFKSRCRIGYDGRRLGRFLFLLNTLQLFNDSAQTRPRTWTLPEEHVDKHLELGRCSVGQLDRWLV